MTPSALHQDERSFQAAVVEYAKLNGWMVFHPYDSRRSEPGYPDLTMVRDGVLVFAELKVGKNKTTPAQKKWLEALHSVEEVSGIGTATNVVVWVWTPEQWDTIERTLARRP